MSISFSFLAPAVWPHVPRRPSVSRLFRRRMVTCVATRPRAHMATLSGQNAQAGQPSASTARPETRLANT